ncbi:hypothetical protein MRB53_038782 [Persea americana]|nr:hypothetical protein MRB53_038782 [Persea americana]
MPSNRRLVPERLVVGVALKSPRWASKVVCHHVVDEEKALLLQRRVSAAPCTHARRILASRHPSSSCVAYAITLRRIVRRIVRRIAVNQPTCLRLCLLQSLRNAHFFFPLWVQAIMLHREDHGEQKTDLPQAELANVARHASPVMRHCRVQETAAEDSARSPRNPAARPISRTRRAPVSIVGERLRYVLDGGDEQLQPTCTPYATSIHAQLAGSMPPLPIVRTRSTTTNRPATDAKQMLSIVLLGRCGVGLPRIPPYPREELREDDNLEHEDRASCMQSPRAAPS